MKSQVRRILNAVNKAGELSLKEVLDMTPKRFGDHRDQYPLTLLLEDGYLGVTFVHTPPTGAESMREFSHATALHMFTLPKKSDGSVDYLGIVSRGGMTSEGERIFIKAKGSLYLEEFYSKRTERLFALFIAIVGAFLGAWLATRL